jgi:hypothetical protein
MSMAAGRTSAARQSTCKTRHAQMKGEVEDADETGDAASLIGCRERFVIGCRFLIIKLGTVGIRAKSYSQPGMRNWESRFSLLL